MNFLLTNLEFVYSRIQVFWPLHSLHLETWTLVKVPKLKVMEVEEAEKIVLLTSAR